MQNSTEIESVRIVVAAVVRKVVWQREKVTIRYFSIWNNYGDGSGYSRMV